MSALGALSHLLPRGSAIAIVFKVIARIFALLLAVVLFMPSGMMSDSGTIPSLNAANTAVVGCLLIMLSGIFGNLNMFALGVFTVILGCLIWSASDTMSQLVTNLYLWVVVPVAFIWILGCQFQVLPSPFDIYPRLNPLYIHRHEAASNVTTEYVSIHDEESGEEDLNH